MLSLLAAVLFSPRPSLYEQLDALAQKRDTAGVAGLSNGISELNFAFLKGQGAYGVGRYGWHVLPLHDPGTGLDLAVFGTRITSEDIGEPVFVVSDNKLSRMIREEETGGFNMDHLSLNIGFEPLAKKTNIFAKADFSRTKDNAGPLLIRMSDHYKISKITNAADNKPVDFVQASGVTAIKPQPGQKFSYNIEYSGVVNLPGFAGAITDTEVMLTNDYWWPILSRRPIAFNSQITVPSDWTAVTNGELISDETKDGQRTLKYQCDLPICYLSLSAAPFAVAEKKVNGITYRIWSKEMTPKQMAQQLEFYPPIIEFYSQFKKHPFRQYGAVVTRLYGGGALEAYSYATYGTGWLPDEDGHEPAHTWFGGIIPNSYLSSFWNESFAEFMDNMYKREGPIGNPVDKRLAFAQKFSPSNGYNQAPVGSSGASAGAVASDLGYGKGAAVLQQLEIEVGHDKMVSALKTWLSQYPNGKAGDWPEFEQIFGPDMKWFFDQWLRLNHWPDFGMDEVKKTKGYIEGKIAFVGDPYKLTVEALIRSASKGDQIVKVLLNPNRQTSSTFRIACPDDATLVAFDPYERLLRRRTGATPPRFSDGGFRAVIDPKHPEYAEGRKSTDWDGKTIKGFKFIGSPETMPLLKDLCAKAGFTVSGSKLTYKGKTYDLASNAGVAVVDLPDGGRCQIQIGTLELGAKTGGAQTAVVDKLGRFLAGYTPPRIQGDIAFNLK